MSGDDRRLDVGLGTAMLICVALTHIGSDQVALHFGLDRAATFYVARGLEGAFLYGLWFKRSPCVAAAALWGMVESAMTSVCGSLYIIEPIEPVPMQGLCDAQIGMPAFTYSGLVAASVLAMSLAIRRVCRGN